MFKNQMQRVAILTPGATGVNVKEDTTVGVNWAVVCADNTADPVVAYLPPILKNAKNVIATQASAAEVVRVECLNIDDETLVASTRYSVLLEQQETKYESQSDPIGKYAYTTPTASLGSAALDRANLVTILVDKINAHASNRVAAYAIEKVAFTGGDTATPVYGETTLESVSGTTAIVVKIEITSGTILGADAAGYLYLYSSIAVAGITNTITCSGGGTFDVAAAGVASQDILLINDGSYFRDGNKGYVNAINADGFTYHTVTAIRAATYEQGIGTHMLLDVPRFDESGQKMLSGSMEYYTANYQLPVAGRTYTRVEVTCFRPGVIDPMSNVPAGEYETTLVIWADEVDATNLTNFTTALAAHILNP